MSSKTNSLFRTFGKVLALFLTMLSGGLMPQAHELAFLIRYFVMAMLFFAFLGKIKEAYDKNTELDNLVLDEYFKGEIDKAQSGWRRMIAAAVSAGIPVPAMSSALAFYDGYRNERLPANLLQAQRDYFGAHTYERVDKPRGEFFHTNWTGAGGDVTSSTYNA